MLKIKNLKIKSFSENVAYINKKCTSYDVSKIKSITKIEIVSKDKKAHAILQLVEDDAVVSEQEIGLNIECFNTLGLKEGTEVNISIAPSSDSFSSVRRKIYGNTLSQAEYANIVNDITTRNYTNTGVASFLVSIGSFMTLEEVLSFTKALIPEKKLSWNTEGIVADHYCVGGLPGNKTDIIILAIVAAYGITIPKTCSYSLTSSCGMGNVAGAFMNIDYNQEGFRNLVEKNNAAMVLYDGLEDVGVFNKHISPIEGYIGLVKAEILASSILAIKATCGITHLLVDIPVGPYTKIRTSSEALKVRKIFEYLGDNLGMKVEVVITDGSETIGDGIGSFLEARDIMKILKNQETAPSDLREKAIFLAGKILDFDPKLRGGQGALVAEEILSSGRALEAFNKIVIAQGRQPKPEMDPIEQDVFSQKSGTITSIDTGALNYLAILAGSSRNKGSGIDIIKKVDDEVSQGDVLFKIYAKNHSDFAKAQEFLSKVEIYSID